MKMELLDDYQEGAKIVIEEKLEAVMEDKEDNNKSIETHVCSKVIKTNEIIDFHSNLLK